MDFRFISLPLTKTPQNAYRYISFSFTKISGNPDTENDFFLSNSEYLLTAQAHLQALSGVSDLPSAESLSDIELELKELIDGELDVPLLSKSSVKYGWFNASLALIRWCGLNFMSLWREKNKQ